MDNILAPRFIDPVAARKHLEALRWPDGAECPHCGLIERYAVTGGPRGAVSVQCVPRAVHRHRWHRVRAFKGRRSTNGCSAIICCARGKKGISAHQIHRMLGVTYKTAWFMCHRIREAMKRRRCGPLGGPGKVVEADEAFIGGSAHKSFALAVAPKKSRCFALSSAAVMPAASTSPMSTRERSARACRQFDRASDLRTDGPQSTSGRPRVSPRMAHVDHRFEYVRGAIHSNTAKTSFPSSSAE